jgi:hypothetical protein
MKKKKRKRKGRSKKGGRWTKAQGWKGRVQSADVLVVIVVEHSAQAVAFEIVNF